MSYRLLALGLVVLLGTAPSVFAEDKPEHIVQAFLRSVTLGTPTTTDEVVIFPLIAMDKPAALDVQPSTWASAVGYTEPEFPKRRHDLGVINNETKPLLLLGGSLLEGGERDRVIPSDVLIPVGARLEIHTIVASPASEQRKEAKPFVLDAALAPSYVRERAEFSPSNTLVPNFAARFLEFRKEGDERKSLAAINGSDRLAQLCVACHQTLAAFPTVEGGRVIGVITAVRGRVRSLELFGDNRLFKAFFEPLLKSQTFAAAAIAVKAKEYNLDIPAGNLTPEALKDLAMEATDLLEQVKTATLRDGDTPKHSMGQVTLLRTRDSTRGAALTLGDRVVHLAVFPYEPFEHAFFGSKVDAPDEPAEYGSAGEPALERKGRHGRLTEFEKRLLDRMRTRR